MKDPATQETVLAVQDLVLRQVLMLMEPIIPFITEELWQNLGFNKEGESFLQDSKLLKAEELRNLVEQTTGSIDEAARDEIESVKELISRIRAMKSEYNVASRRDIPFLMLAEEGSRAVVQSHVETILNLAQIKSLELVEARPDGMPAGVTGLGTAFLDLAQSIDVGAERSRLEKELAKLEKGIRAGEGKLKNEKFLTSAPEAVVNGAREQLATTKAKFEEIQNLLQSLPSA